MRSRPRSSRQKKSIPGSRMADAHTSGVLRDAKRIVVKVGSSLVTNEGRGLDEKAIA